MSCMFGLIGSGIFGLLVFLVMAAISLACFAFWLWMLIHAITNKGLTDTEKIVWVIVVIFLHVPRLADLFLRGPPQSDRLAV